MTTPKYFVAVIVGTALSGIGLNELYLKPKVRELEEKILAEEKAREKLSRVLQQYSIPVDDGLLRMTISGEGRPVFWNKLRSDEIQIEELSGKYKLMKR